MLQGGRAADDLVGGRDHALITITAATCEDQSDQQRVPIVRRSRQAVVQAVGGGAPVHVAVSMLFRRFLVLHGHKIEDYECGCSSFVCYSACLTAPGLR